MRHGVEFLAVGAHSLSANPCVNNAVVCGGATATAARVFRAEFVTGGEGLTARALVNAMFAAAVDA